MLICLVFCLVFFKKSKKLQNNKQSINNPATVGIISGGKISTKPRSHHLLLFKEKKIKKKTKKKRICCNIYIKKSILIQKDTSFSSILLFLYTTTNS